MTAEYESPGALARKAEAGYEVQCQANELVIATRREMGALTIRMVPDRSAGGRPVTSGENPPSLAGFSRQLGVSESSLRRSEALATLPDEKVEAFIAKRRLATYHHYNASAKGKARTARYRAKTAAQQLRRSQCRRHYIRHRADYVLRALRVRMARRAAVVRQLLTDLRSQEGG